MGGVGFGSVCRVREPDEFDRSHTESLTTLHPHYACILASHNESLSSRWETECVLWRSDQGAGEEGLEEGDQGGDGLNGQVFSEWTAKCKSLNETSVKVKPPNIAIKTRIPLSFVRPLK